MNKIIRTKAQQQAINNELTKINDENQIIIKNQKYLMPTSVFITLLGSIKHNFDLPINVRVYNLNNKPIIIPCDEEVIAEVKRMYPEEFL